MPPHSLHYESVQQWMVFADLLLSVSCCCWCVPMAVQTTATC